MRRYAAVLLTLLLWGALAGCQGRSTAEGEGEVAAQKKTEWRPLFNGRDLSGWEHVGPGGFVVEDGVLRTESGMGLLWYTQEKLGDCVLRVVYRTSDPASNSGVFIRIADKPKDEWFAVHNGYEVQINDTGPSEFHRTGAIYSLAPAASLPVNPPGEWNTMEITLQGDTVLVDVNGQRVTEFDSSKPLPERKQTYEPERGPRPAQGYIGLQNHDDEAAAQKGRQTNVYFKEVSVRPL